MQRQQILVALLIVVTLILIVALIVTGLALRHASKDCSTDPPVLTSATSTTSTRTSVSTVATTMASVVPIDEKLIFNLADKTLQINGQDRKTLLAGHFGYTVSGPYSILKNEPNELLRVNWPKSKCTLIVRRSSYSSASVVVYEIEWKNEKLFTLMDTFELGGSSWYGGTEMFKQHWPIDTMQFSMNPYVTNDIYKGQFGSVQERYWLSSNKIAITVDNEIPLWLSMNDMGGNELSFQSQYKKSVFANFIGSEAEVLPSLRYQIWIGSTTMKDLHLNVIEKRLGKPRDRPNARMMKSPVWSTWARYKKEVNQTRVAEFANEILNHTFTNSQLEIDDKWAPHYGDLELDPKKFSDPKAMIADLNSKGFDTTIWVHPFMNFNSKVVQEALENQNFSHFVHSSNPDFPNPIKWWDGFGFSVDPTSQDAADWFVNRLQSFLNETGINSFKFDAGEVNWLGPSFRLGSGKYPNQYTTDYVNMCARLGNQIEVRSGTGSQSNPIFVRIMDKDSKWTDDNVKIQK